MTTPSSPSPETTRFARWARRLRERGLAPLALTLLEAGEPWWVVGGVAFAGGRFLLSPWVSEESLQALNTLLEDPAQREALARALQQQTGASSS